MHIYTLPACTLIHIPVPWPLALNRLASSVSDHCYGHQCNHHPTGAPVCVVYFKSCHSLAQKVSPIGAICPSSQCLPCFLKVAHPVLRLQHLITFILSVNFASKNLVHFTGCIGETLATMPWIVALSAEVATLMLSNSPTNLHFAAIVLSDIEWIAILHRKHNYQQLTPKASPPALKWELARAQA